jgi:hypothetical protein
LREKVKAELDSMVDAQIASDKGIKFLVVRDKGTGRIVRVTESMIGANLESTEEVIEVWEKDPRRLASQASPSK